MTRRLRPGRAPLIALLLGTLVLGALALLREPDHDESQYVAAAVLTAHGLLPYRDFAWLQTPLQPFAFAPLVALAGTLAWPAMRLASTLLGLGALVGVYRAARAGGAAAPVATLAAALFAGCDAFLFGAASARNDMLPLALLALALAPAIRLAQGDGSRGAAVAVGLLLGAATTAKISYAFPALVIAVWSLRAPHRRHAAWLMLGALPPAMLLAATAWASPDGFWFGAVTFPLDAPSDFYSHRPDKLTWWRKLVDLAKFLALGAAPIALLAVWRARRSPGDPARRVLCLFLVAGLVAAALPTPVWRQYLLPLLAPLFVLLALAWQARPPARRLRIATTIFVGAGLAPSLLPPWTFPEAMRQGRAVGAALDRAGVRGPVATLAPQFLPAAGRLPDPRFAAGPFVFRSKRLLTAAHAGAHDSILGGAVPPLAPVPVLVGGEAGWTGGDIALDRAFAATVRRQGYRPVAVPGGRFVLLLPATRP